MKNKIIKEIPASAVEVKELLEANRAKHGELSFRAQKTLDHLQGVVMLNTKKAKELEAKIAAKEIPRMRDQYIKKLVDTLPTSDKDARVILSGLNVTFTNEDLQTIVRIIKEYVTE